MLHEDGNIEERLREIEDETVRLMARAAVTVLLTNKNFMTRPEPIDLFAFVDAMEILFAKKELLKAAAEGRLRDLLWWPEDDHW